MKANSLKELKTELQNKEKSEIIELCLKLTKNNKNNKELLSFLLFDINNINLFVENSKSTIESSLREISINQYLAKKTLRKTLKETRKLIRFAEKPTVEIELLLHFIEAAHDSGLNLNKSAVINNIIDNQFKKINTTILKLHEDLQFDYQQKVEALLNKTKFFKPQYFDF
ncbi:MAG: hypothetical protein EAZ07_00425 [Cytophagales bacterium]|nr:MAG: hypothetical protein EAZ07_00425 [Cytophagales bacterium]